jgi:hypothetical protein
MLVGEQLNLDVPPRRAAAGRQQLAMYVVPQSLRCGSIYYFHE